jgi:hypothetical protein
MSSMTKFAVGWYDVENVLLRYLNIAVEWLSLLLHIWEVVSFDV